MNKKNIFKGLLFTAAFVFAFTAVKPAKLTAFAAESGDEGTTIADINPSGGSLSLDTMPPADETQIDLSLLGGEDDSSLNDAAENAESQISEDSSAKNTTASKEATAATAPRLMLRRRLCEDEGCITGMTSKSLSTW